MKSLFHPSGGFRAHIDGEVDVRVTYAIVYLIDTLQLFENAEISQLLQKTIEYVRGHLTYQSCICGQFGEGHCAYLFCGLAALKILKNHGLVTELFPREVLHEMLHFISLRQTGLGGFNGRTNKLVDGCYNHWVGGALKLVIDELNLKSEKKLGIDDFIDRQAFNNYTVKAAQDPKGGLRDKPGEDVDRYHTCYVLMGWAIVNNVIDIEPEYGFY